MIVLLVKMSHSWEKMDFCLATTLGIFISKAHRTTGTAEDEQCWVFDHASGKDHVDGKLTPPLITLYRRDQNNLWYITYQQIPPSLEVGEELRYAFHSKYSSTLDSWFLPGIPLLSICGFRTHGSNFLPVFTQRHWERPGGDREQTLCKYEACEGIENWRVPVLPRGGTFLLVKGGHFAQ